MSDNATETVARTVDSRVSDVLPMLRATSRACDTEARFPKESLQALRDHGLLGLTVPREYGGEGVSMEKFTRVCGQLASACLSTAQIWAMHCFQVDAIARHGSPELRASLLPRVAAGRVYIASVTSERGSSDLFSAHSPLARNGDGHLLLRRTAPVVTGGAHADGYLVTMRSEGSASDHDVAWVYVDRSDLERNETTGQWDTLGMRGTESLGLELQGRVPVTNILGPDPQGRSDVARESMIPMSHIGWSACWLGTARAALSEVVGSLRRNKLGSADQSELLFERLGGIRLDLELVSAYLTRARDMVAEARSNGTPLARPSSQLQLNTLKVAASEMTFDAVNRMVQVAGLRLGYSRQSSIPLERHLRDLRAASLNHSNDGLRVGIGAFTLMDQSGSLI